MSFYRPRPTVQKRSNHNGLTTGKNTVESTSDMINETMGTTSRVQYETERPKKPKGSNFLSTSVRESHGS